MSRRTDGLPSAGIYRLVIFMTEFVAEGLNNSHTHLMYDICE